MPHKPMRKLSEVVEDLARCIASYKPSDAKGRSITFIAVTKAFEVGLEYGWKFLKIRVEESGLEANSPKDAVREAAHIGLIKNPDIWIAAINARNQSVHDYFSMSEGEFVKLIEGFSKELKKLAAKKFD